MKVSEIECLTFRYRSKVVRDSEGHAHPGPEHDARQHLVRVRTDDGAEGYSIGGDPAAIREVVRPAVLGEDPFARERIWQDLRRRQRLHKGLLNDAVLASVDLALWDLAGRSLGQPVQNLLGSSRDEVPAYASTMCGDDIEGGLNTPGAYADFALRCKGLGYTAFKLHTWMPPIPGAPDPKRDVSACRAVREAVGEDMDLMLDPYHFYSRHEALYLATELEGLGFHWIEEPMDEHSASSYVWLTERSGLPVVGP